MFDYRGPARCVLPDGTALPVTVNLRSESGLLDGLTGTAAGGGVAFMNLAELALRLPDGRRRMFRVKDAAFSNGTGGSLTLVSNGDWLSSSIPMIFDGDHARESAT